VLDFDAAGEQGDGAVSAGLRRLGGLRVPLGGMPIYARRRAGVPIYPAPVQCTDEMDMRAVESLRFDASHRGLASILLGRVAGIV
jgi:hypothetical protein